MKKITIKPLRLLFMLFAFTIVACSPSENPHQDECKHTPEPVEPVRKIVKGKSQSEETTYRYKYNIWKGNFYHQPNIHTVYYIVYTDGSFDKVDVGTYTITNIGDTITK